MSLNDLEKRVYDEVSQYLGKDESGHGMDHIERVFLLAFQLAKEEVIDRDVLGLIALLHDVDDAKLFGEEAAKELRQAKIIMQTCRIKADRQAQVLAEIRRIGFKKRMRGIIPISIEAKLVSDADMLDALGAHGILRTYDYGKSQNHIFFDRDCFPSNDPLYPTEPSINHFFEKLLRLEGLMLTEKGKKEAAHRSRVMRLFLKSYFAEEGATDWLSYLAQFDER